MRLNTFRSFKGRNVAEGQRVKVYKNLNNGLWSIKDCKSGLVLGHAEEVVLSEVKFSVGKKGRERVIAEQVKNVHAYVIGKLVTTEKLTFDISKVDEVYYNPYKQDHFTIKATKQEIKKSHMAVATNGVVFAIKK